MIEHLHSSPVKPGRVVLLGARGFVGAALNRSLQSLGVDTLALGSADLNLAHSNAAADLAARLRPSDTIVMAAAITPDKGRDAAASISNLAMMQSVCAAITKAGCAHLIYLSSDAVYDSAVSLVSESTSASPHDLYGAIHRTREIMALNLANVPVLILRPTLIYGIDDTHNSYGPNRFRRSAQKDGTISLFGEGEETRDHIHVDDVAALVVRCILHRSTGILNGVTGTSLSFRGVAALVSRQFDRDITIVPTPRRNPVTHRHYDPTAVIKAFPDFRFVPLDEGIARVHRQMLDLSRG